MIGAQLSRMAARCAANQCARKEPLEGALDCCDD
jgi:hypothetical protein